MGKKVFSAAVTVGGVTFLVRIADTGKYLAIAREFGTGNSLDAFFMAMLVPTFIINVIAGSLNSAFIPTYIQIRETHGPAKARELFSNILNLSGGLFIVLSLILYLAGSKILYFLASGFELGKLNETIALFYYLVPVIFLAGVINLGTSVLNAEEHFALAAISPISVPLAVLAAILITKSALGIDSLVVGTLGGSLIQACLLFWKVKDTDFSFYFRWPKIDSQVIQIARQYGPMIGGAFLMGSTDLIDTSMAAMLGPGSVSVLNYSNKIVAFVIGIGGMALGTAVFPQFSRLSAAKDWARLKDISKSYGALVLIATIPFTAALIIYSQDLVRLLFQRGAFGASDTHLVGKVQAFYLLQIPFYLTAMIGVRMLSALKKNHILMAISGINLVANIVGNYILMRYLDVAGISLSTSIVYFISMVLVFMSVFGNLKKIECKALGN